MATRDDDSSFIATPQWPFGRQHAEGGGRARGESKAAEDRTNVTSKHETEISSRVVDAITSGDNAELASVINDEEKEMPAGAKFRRMARRKPFYGTRPPVTNTIGPDTYDYTQVFPEDEPYTEMGPHARVWKVYNHEMARLDSDRIEDWRDSLDSLLVFAALFSGVITGFALQATKNLEKDWDEVNAHLLTELVTLQHITINGNPTNMTRNSPLTATSPFSPKTSDVVVSVLWFFSLSLSLGTALAAIVSKQWIHQYAIIPPSGHPHERARIHHFRLMGLEKWHVITIIGCLPTFIHLSLLVFFLGLSIFLHGLSPIVGSMVDVIVWPMCLLYIIANFLPIWYLNCPYRTPLTLFVFQAIGFLHQCYYLLDFALHKLYFQLRREIYWRGLDHAKIAKIPKSLLEAEKAVADAQGPITDIDILFRLISSSSNASIHKIAIEAISNLPPCNVKRFLALSFSYQTIRRRMWKYIECEPVTDEYGRAVRTALRLNVARSLDRWGTYSPHRAVFRPMPMPFNLVFQTDTGLVQTKDLHSWDTKLQIHPYPTIEMIGNALQADQNTDIQFEPALWCFYLDIINEENMGYEKLHSLVKTESIWWPLVNVALSINISHCQDHHNWSTFLHGLDFPHGPNYFNMVKPCTIWEFFQAYKHPLLPCLVLPFLQKQYEQCIPPHIIRTSFTCLAAYLTPSPEPDGNDLPGGSKSHLKQTSALLRLMHYVVICPKAWYQERTIHLLFEKLKDISLSWDNSKDFHEEVYVIAASLTWLMFSPEISLSSDYYALRLYVAPYCHPLTFFLRRLIATANSDHLVTIPILPLFEGFLKHTIDAYRSNGTCADDFADVLCSVFENCLSTLPEYITESFKILCNKHFLNYGFLRSRLSLPFLKNLTSLQDIHDPPLLTEVIWYLFEAGNLEQFCLETLAVHESSLKHMAMFAQLTMRLGYNETAYKLRWLTCLNTIKEDKLVSEGSQAFLSCINYLHEFISNDCDGFMPGLNNEANQRSWLSKNLHKLDIHLFKKYNPRDEEKGIQKPR